MGPTTGGKSRPWRADQLEIGAQLRQVVEAGTVAVIADAGKRELALSDDAGQGGVGGRQPTVKSRIDESRDGHPSRWREDGDQRSPGSVRSDADKAAARGQPLPRSPEGMDHAPECDSSKGPAEEGDVERSAARGHALDGAQAKGDISDAEHGLLVQRFLDAGWIRVDGQHLCGGSCVLEGEPAIAAADLKDALPVQCGETLDQSDLHPVGRIRGDVKGRSHGPDAIAVRHNIIHRRFDKRGADVQLFSCT